MHKPFHFIHIAALFILFLTGCGPDKKIPTSHPTSSEATLQAAIDTPSITPTPDQPTSTPTTHVQPTTEPTISATPTEIATLSPTQTPISLPTDIPAPTDIQQGDDCLDEAAFYADVTIPDDTLFDANTPFTKVWQVLNTGTCTWGDGYALVFAKGDVMDGPLSSPIPTVPPGEIAEISVNMVAPARGGQQTGYWEFQNPQGTRFGVGSGGHDYIWVQIQVDWSSSSDSQQPTAEPSAAPGSSGGCSAAEMTSFENQVLSLINSARESAGLPALTRSSQLAAAALRHSQDMACADFVDHTGSDGSTWYDRAASHGYANYSSARENIYVGDPDFGGTPDGAFTWWMNSQVHRDNILNAAISEIGVGYVYYSDSTYEGYFTVVFARP